MIFQIEVPFLKSLENGRLSTLVHMMSLYCFLTAGKARCKSFFLKVTGCLAVHQEYSYFHCVVVAKNYKHKGKKYIFVYNAETEVGFFISVDFG